MSLIHMTWLIFRACGVFLLKIYIVNQYQLVWLHLLTRNNYAHKHSLLFYWRVFKKWTQVGKVWVLDNSSYSNVRGSLLTTVLCQLYLHLLIWNVKYKFPYFPTFPANPCHPANLGNPVFEWNRNGAVARGAHRVWPAPSFSTRRSNSQYKTKTASSRIGE